MYTATAWSPVLESDYFDLTSVSYCFPSLFGATVDGVVALEQASSPGRVLASVAFAELVGPGLEHSQSSPDHFALAPGGSLGGVWLDAPFAMDRPNMATFMRSRPQKASAMIVVEDLFAEEVGGSMRHSISLGPPAGSSARQSQNIYAGTSI